MATKLITLDGKQINELADLACATLNSEPTKRAYKRGIVSFLLFCKRTRSPRDRTGVGFWMGEMRNNRLSPATINQALAAIKHLFNELEMGGHVAEYINHGVQRVKSIRTSGSSIGNWLDKKQVKELLTIGGDKPKRGDKRDRAIMAVMIACGLRRQEIVDLTFAHIEFMYGQWVIVDLIGKGNKARSIPLPLKVKGLIDDYAKASKHFCVSCKDDKNTPIFVSNTKTYHEDGSYSYKKISGQTIYNIVVKHGNRIGLNVRPHDLRRTGARLMYDAGAPISQIQQVLGHSTVVITERYLNLHIDLENPITELVELGI